MGLLFDPKTSIMGSLEVILGSLGGHFSDLGAHFGDLGWPGAPLEGQKRTFHGFTATIRTRRLRFGGHFGVILVTFCDFAASKCEAT